MSARIVSSLAGQVLLEPGDLGLTRSPGFVGWGIRVASRDWREKPSMVNHAFVVVSAGFGGGAKIVEAVGKGVVYHALSAYDKRNCQVAIFRPNNLTDEETRLVVEGALKQVGRPYGYGKIAAHFLDWGIGRLSFRKRAPVLFRKLTRKDNWPVCSGVYGTTAVAVEAYAAAAKKFGYSGYELTPDDIWDFATTSGYYDQVRTLSPWP